MQVVLSFFVELLEVGTRQGELLPAWEQRKVVGKAVAGCPDVVQMWLHLCPREALTLNACCRCLKGYIIS